MVFERTMADQLKRIFGMDKVTFDPPSESQEQEAVFIGIETVKTKVVDARQIARVTGTIRVFASADKMPYGYLAKRLQESAQADTQNFFFFNEENRGTIRNIVERSVEFLYLFDSQFDPAIGTLTSVNLSISES